MTSLPKNHIDFDLPIERILHTDCPNYDRYAEDGETEEAFVTRCAGNLRALIEGDSPDTIAVFFAERVWSAKCGAQG